jgi:single-strand DNA-binding protein
MFLELTVIGHIGRDAVANNVNGKTVLNFSVAHTEKFKDAQGNQREQTTWVSCQMWERPNLQQYLKKGSVVHLTGKPEVRLYVSNTGEKRVELRLRIKELTLLPSGNREAAQQTPMPAHVTQQERAAIASSFNDGDLANDDLPF